MYQIAQTKQRKLENKESYIGSAAESLLVFTEFQLLILAN